MKYEDALHSLRPSTGKPEEDNLANNSKTLLQNYVSKEAAPKISTREIDRTDKKSDLKIIPNPNKGVFTISNISNNNADKAYLLCISELSGKLIYTEKIIARNGIINQSIDINERLINGLYLLSLQSEQDSKVYYVNIEK